MILKINLVLLYENQNMEGQQVEKWLGYGKRKRTQMSPSVFESSPIFRRTLGSLISTNQDTF